jgi:hypothetical protein
MGFVLSLFKKVLGIPIKIADRTFFSMPLELIDDLIGGKL